MPEHIWPEFKVRARLAYQAPSRGIARELAAGVVTHYAVSTIRNAGLRLTSKQETQ
jgi:hypothetical protein